MRLVLFGSPALETDRGARALPFERRGQLLAFLALRRDWVSRAELASVLWPDQESRLAYTNLRKALFRLQALAGAPPVESDAGAMRLVVETDVAEFERALASGDADRALAIRRGELLAGFEEDANEAWTRWLAFERERLRSAWREAALARLAAAPGPEEALEISQRLLDADPLDEAAMGAHLEALVASGQGARARAVLRLFADRLDRELGVAPSAALEAKLGAGAAAPVPAPAPRPGKADDGFIGRSVEIRQVVERLTAGDCRLLTLVGPGGVGKTRLARRIEQELAPSFADRTRFVALEDADSLEEAFGRLARDLGAKPDAKSGGTASLARRIGAERRLLVLDNFEHLAAQAALVPGLLAACPGLSLLATSRERLGLAEEWVQPLDGLPCPEPEDLDRLEAFDAARLFIAVARRVAPDFAPAREADAIVDICRQVGGLPLALQLAAAWTRVLPGAQIAAELRHGAELLRAVDPAHPARHASFDVVFDQSWRLLGAVEREALARLSVFRGGFTAEAAKAVAGAGLAVLGALVDKSLVRREEGRMLLHPLVQQCAARRLGEGAARDRAIAAHAEYFHHRLASRESGVERGERAALAELDAEFENLRAAWQHAVATDREALVARHVRALAEYCDHRGRLEEGVALLGQALAMPSASRKGATRALVLAMVASLRFRQDRYAEAEATATEAFAAARTARDVPAQKKALSVMASAAGRQGRLAESAGRIRKALALGPDPRRPEWVAGLLDNLATIEKRLGNLDESLRLSVESLAEHRRIGDGGGVALCLNNAGSLCIQRGELRQARAYLEEARAIAGREGYTVTHALVLCNLAGLDLLEGDATAARAHAELALPVAETHGLRFLSCWLSARLARIAARLADPGTAGSRLAEAATKALDLATVQGHVTVLAATAEVLGLRGEPAAARVVLALGEATPGINASEREELALAARSLAGAGDGRIPAGLTVEGLLRHLAAGTGDDVLLARLAGR